MRGGHHQDSYCVLWEWHLTASRFEGRVPSRFFGIRDFHYLKLGIRDLKEKSGRVSRLKVCTGGGMPKITLGITGLHEIWGRDYMIEEPYWGTSFSMVGLWTDGHSHETRLCKKRAPFNFTYKELHLPSLAYITGVLWAKRGEHGILREALDEGRRNALFFSSPSLALRTRCAQNSALVSLGS